MPRRFAPRNDRGGGMSLRATFLPPRTRPSFSMSLRTSAHTCGNPRPAGILYKLAAVSANSLRLTDLTEVLLFVLCSRRGWDCHVASLLAMTEGEACHCEQRSCPRAHVLPSACHCEPVRTPAAIRVLRGYFTNWLLFRRIRYALRICPKYYFSFCAAT